MIQWFPGHMKKAIREVEKMAVIADLFIVVLDSRAPLTSYNFEFDKIHPNKPRLFVFAKKDLADKSKTSKIMSDFKQKNNNVILANIKKQSDVNKIYRKMDQILIQKREKDQKKQLLKSRLRAIVIGIPNVGKSTLINTLAKKKMTKTGNRPGVTRGQQWISLPNIQLLDTPGILWPKFEEEEIAIKLAMIGSIKYEIINKEDFLFKALLIVAKNYPGKLAILGFKNIFDINQAHQETIEFGKRKNFIIKKGELNWNKTVNFLINYIRDLRGVTYDE